MFFLTSSSVLPSLDSVALRANFPRPVSPVVSLPSRLKVRGPIMPPMRPPPPPPGGPPAGAPAGGGPPVPVPTGGPPVVFSSIVISLSVCVITQETLSEFCCRGLRPWLLLLSSVQVPAKFGAAACATRANTSALVRPKAKSNFLIQDLLQFVWIITEWVESTKTIAEKL